MSIFAAQNRENYQFIIIMSNNINLKKGLNIPISGVATLETKKTIEADIIAVSPVDFKGFTPRLLVKEGDNVLAGSPVLADKQNPDILLCSPVSGTVHKVVRGDKRKLLAVLVKADGKNESVDFGVRKPAEMTSEAVKEALLASGLWTAIVQRPYGIIADPALKPKAIFISAFSTAPLAADTEYAFKDDFAAIQAGVTAVSKLSEVHICVNGAESSFAKLENAAIHVVNGSKHPAGNVGVQISHISPIQKGETVWTLSLQSLAAIGKLFTQGKVNLMRKVAVTGPKAAVTAYVNALPGTCIKDFKGFYSKENLRFISGDVLSGANVGEGGCLRFFDNQITILEEGDKYELLGWAKPVRCKQFSSSRTYFSWLTPNKKYDMDTNLHGGPRAFVVNDVYGKVLPMDIFPVHLLKACLANDIEKMEKFGIYEVLEEDLALCEYVCPSKIDIQDIIRNGIDLMLKEMC